MVTLVKNVSYDVWMHILEFLYTGMISKTKDVQDILATAELFKYDQLATICRNIMENNEFLNPSIGMSPVAIHIKN